DEPIDHDPLAAVRPSNDGAREAHAGCGRGCEGRSMPRPDAERNQRIGGGPGHCIAPGWVVVRDGGGGSGHSESTVGCCCCCGCCCSCGCCCGARLTVTV